MAQATVNIEIKDWDDKLEVRNLSLHQPFNSHHTFELVAPVPADFNLTSETVKKIMGEDAKIEIVNFVIGNYDLLF